MTTNIAILGSTGSIGTQTLEVIGDLESSGQAKFNVSALTCGQNIELLARQIEQFNPKVVGVKDEEKKREISKLIPNSVKVLTGSEGLVEIANLSDTELLVNALVGFVGLEPTLTAVESGKKLLLANKESLVVGGKLVDKLLEKNPTTILPIDSEHNAIFQALQAGKPKEVAQLIITASGGPFRNTPIEEIDAATPDQALNHPNWSMGHRITCDSATMVNKGFEIIEAHWLFGLEYERIDAVLHPQSYVHSLIEYHDGSIIAELGEPDMKIPIQYTLTYPNRLTNNYQQTSLTEIANLEFRELDPERYPAFEVVVRAGKLGGNRPAAINGADEALIDQFLLENISFGDIATGLRYVLNEVEPIEDPTLEDLRKTDSWARKTVKCLVEDQVLGI